MLEIVGERPGQPGHFEPHHDGVFLGFLERGRRIEIPARVILRGDEKPSRVARTKCIASGYARGDIMEATGYIFGTTRAFFM